MKPDSMIVESEYIADAGQEIAAKEVGDSFGQIAEQEPVLAAFIDQSLTRVAGKLALAGAPTPFIGGLHEDVLAVILTCVQAQRRGHYEVWKHMMTDSPGVTVQEKPKRQRRNVEKERHGDESPT